MNRGGFPYVNDMRKLLLNLPVVTSATTKKAPQAAITEPNELKFTVKCFYIEWDISITLAPNS